MTDVFFPPTIPKMTIILLIFLEWQLTLVEMSLASGSDNFNFLPNSMWLGVRHSSVSSE